MSADEILDIIDTDAVANAALWWGDSMEEQHERALAEIERQLLSMGILAGPRIIG